MQGFFSFWKLSVAWFSNLRWFWDKSDLWLSSLYFIFDSFCGWSLNGCWDIYNFNWFLLFFDHFDFVHAFYQAFHCVLSLFGFMPGILKFFYIRLQFVYKIHYWPQPIILISLAIQLFLAFIQSLIEPFSFYLWGSKLSLKHPKSRVPFFVLHFEKQRLLFHVHQFFFFIFQGLYLVHFKLTFLAVFLPLHQFVDYWHHVNVWHAQNLVSSKLIVKLTFRIILGWDW